MSESDAPSPSADARSIASFTSFSGPPATKAVNAIVPDAGISGNQCPVCQKRYDRLDHLKRHIRSHENARPYRCQNCPRKFNRRDLLTRHQATAHETNTTAQRKESRHLPRAIQACQPCIAAKTKCDDTRPCQRCANRGLICADDPANRRSALLAEDQEGNLLSHAILGPTQSEAHGQPNKSNEPVNLAQASDITMATSLLDDIAMSGLTSTSRDIASNAMPLSNTELPSHNFDAPPLDGFEDEFWTDFVFHADLSQIYQDLDFQFDAMLSPLDADIRSLDNSAVGQMASQDNGHASIQAAPVVDATTTNPASLGFEAFKRSPWLWTPANQDHAYAEHSLLAVDSEKILEAPQFSSGRQGRSLCLPEIKQSATRDEILAMVLKFSKSTIKVRSFPSLRLLGILMQAFFVRQRASLDPWIHEPSFDPDRSQPPLLAAMIATGSSLFAAPNIWKMGLALQEIVKLAICDALDEDNRHARQLQTGQIFLYWIELGLWSGFRRKMEIGESFAHVVPTMLRRAGAFQFSYYATTGSPNRADEGEVLRQKWLAWIEKESYKRLVFRLLINEMRSSIAFVRSPVFSSVELTLPLPSCRGLWDAQTPEEWKSRFLAKHSSKSTVTLSDAMHDAARLEVDATIIDLGFSAHLTLYGLWGRVWSFLDTRNFQQSDNVSHGKATSLLWSQAQHQELYTHVQRTKEKLARLNVLSPEADLMSEMLMMSLHVCSHDVQRFAGRFGESEVRAALPLLQEWSSRDEHRYATWHAGQVLRAARKTPRTQLRGFLAMAVYHSCLTLWVSSLICKRARMLSGRNSPGPSRGAAGNSGHHVLSSSMPTSTLPQTQDQVILDGDETQATRMYLVAGRGRTCLQLSNEIRDLHDPTVVPKVMMDIFRENFPDKAEPLPPLLENLLSLMDDLSKTPAG